MTLGTTPTVGTTHPRFSGESLMARCEDYPCCGHEQGCCPDYDESGRQLNMRCTCGAVLPVSNRYSICDSCLNTPEPGEDPGDYYDCGENDYYDDEDY